MNMIIRKSIIILALLLLYLFYQTQVFIKFNETIPQKTPGIIKNRLQLLEFNKNKSIYPTVIKALFTRQLKYNNVLNHVFTLNFENEAEADKFFEENSNIAYAELSNIYKVDVFNTNANLIAEHRALKKIKATHAWSISEGSPQFIMVIIDTGIDFLHPDLGNKIAINDLAELF